MTDMDIKQALATINQIVRAFQCDSDGYEAKTAAWIELVKVVQKSEPAATTMPMPTPKPKGKKGKEANGSAHA